MTKKGAILLISCYELGHPPFGVARLASQLAKEGFLAEVQDLAVEKLNEATLFDTALVGISAPMHTALRIGVAAAERIRKINPKAKIAFFGLYAALNKQYLSEHCADFVIEGEEEQPFLDVARGFVTPAKGKQAGAHALPPLSQYAHLERNGAFYSVGYVEASRGCRHLCRHCPIPPVYKGRFKVISEEIVLESIRAQVDRGAAHITFGDPDFFNGPNHSLKIVRKMRKEYPQMTFDFTAKIEHLLKFQGLLSEFAALGCIFIVSAVESLSDTVLRRLDKGHTRANVVEAVGILKNRGIALRPSLVPFTPWSTLEDYVDLFSFAEQYRLIDSIDLVQYTIRLLVPPGSLLLSEPAMAPYLGALIPESFRFQWTHPDPRMDRLQREVSQQVERMAEEDSEVVFYQLKESALAMREGRAVLSIAHSPTPDRCKPPRLTEPWFCCAEPTDNQLACINGMERTI